MTYDSDRRAAYAFAGLTALDVALLLVCLYLAVHLGGHLAVLFAGLVVFLVAGGIYSGYETAALWAGRWPPITWEVDRSKRTHRISWLAVVFAVQTFAGLLAGHFFWSNCPQGAYAARLVAAHLWSHCGG